MGEKRRIEKIVSGWDLPGFGGNWWDVSRFSLYGRFNEWVEINQPIPGYKAPEISESKAYRLWSESPFCIPNACLKIGHF
ncbi:hypothetical protein DSCW_49300 [Desulfosarcina widdelii]|uniref:Uncharacterized protein n=1 Tax=Desulfosarcina widdelii TaxID=947919 RepID=A0A5K7ZCQ6_9BACT|nr:hypothetical protein DSCW_49300 [Desulfosarcina widdelii]